MGHLLGTIARLIFIAFLPLAIMASLIVRIANYKKLDAHLYNIALSVDQLGNVVYRDIFKMLFITKYSEFDFGNADHTISYVIAANKRDGTLTILGYLLGWILDKLDKDHLKKAIQNNEKY
jgi:hypothetical protein